MDDTGEITPLNLDDALKTETFTSQLTEINIFVAQTSRHKYIITKVVVT